MPKVTSVTFTANFQKRHLYLEGSSKNFEKHAKSIENMRHKRGFVIDGQIYGNPIGGIDDRTVSTVIRADSDESLESLEHAILTEMDATTSKISLAAGQQVQFSLNLPAHSNVHYNYFEGNKYKKYHEVPVHHSTHVRLGGILSSNGNGNLNLEINHLDSTSERYSYEAATRT